MMRLKHKGQSSLEYSVLLIVVMAALLTIQIYFKRGVQGRWKETVDELGDQYDPRTAIGNITHTMSGTTETVILTANADNGFHTTRADFSNITESKTGTMTVGTYTN